MKSTHWIGVLALLATMPTMATAENNSSRQFPNPFVVDPVPNTEPVPNIRRGLVRPDNSIHWNVLRGDSLMAPKGKWDSLPSERPPFYITVPVVPLPISVD